jgi:hypothetical protein
VRQFKLRTLTDGKSSGSSSHLEQKYKDVNKYAFIVEHIHIQDVIQFKLTKYPNTNNLNKIHMNNQSPESRGEIPSAKL